MRIWKNGPPPHIGWWNASSVMDDRAWRWWDFEYSSPLELLDICN